jgi:hypothetical protein
MASTNRDRWGKGQPDGKTKDGRKILVMPKVVMDASGKFRDEFIFDYYMCVCGMKI